MQVALNFSWHKRGSLRRIFLYVLENTFKIPSSSLSRIIFHSSPEKLLQGVQMYVVSMYNRLDIFFGQISMSIEDFAYRICLKECFIT